MKRSLIYLVLASALLMDSSPFVSSGWSAGGEIITLEISLRITGYREADDPLEQTQAHYAPTRATE